MAAEPAKSALDERIVVILSKALLAEAQVAAALEYRGVSQWIRWLVSQELERLKKTGVSLAELPLHKRLAKAPITGRVLSRAAMPADQIFDVKQLVQLRWKPVPARRGCYAWVLDNNEVIRVGQSLGLQSRVRSYAGTVHGPLADLKKLIRRCPHRLTLKVWLCDNHVQFEGDLIAHYQPRLNSLPVLGLQPSGNRARLTVWVPAELYDALNASARRAGKYNADVVRAALQQHLKTEE